MVDALSSQYDEDDTLYTLLFPDASRSTDSIPMVWVALADD